MIVKKRYNQVFIPNGSESAAQLTKRYMEFYEKEFAPNYHLTKKAPKREYIPNDKEFAKLSREQKSELITDIVRKWKNGQGEICGMEWAYYNLAEIKRRSGGNIKPIYRNYDNQQFDIMEACLFGRSRNYGNLVGSGIIGLGKRNFGKSSTASMAALTVISLYDSSNVLMTSKTEDDGQKWLEEKAKYTYRRFPTYLRSGLISNNINELHLGKKRIIVDEYGLKHEVIEGRDSKIFIKSPEVTAVEGLGGKMWIHDEAGKTEHLLTLVNNTFPALMNEHDKLEGVPFITGVAGDFDKHGKDYIDLWDAAESKNLIRWFIPGWAGLELDENGNEDVEKAVFEIFKKRIEAFSGSAKNLFDIVQQFPLVPDEALLRTGSGILPTQKIQGQLTYISGYPDLYMTGELEWRSMFEDAYFIPNRNGKVKILEYPDKDADYCGFVDAYDIHKDKKGSSGSTVIFKRKTGISEHEKTQILTELDEETDLYEKIKLYLKLGYIPVAIYTDMPDNPSVYAENSAKLLCLYGCKGAIEKYPSPIFNYYNENTMLRKLIHISFIRPDKKIKESDFVNKGQKFDEYWKDQRNSELVAFYNNSVHKIFFEELLIKGLTYDPKNEDMKHDEIDALGGSLLLDKQPFLKSRVHETSDVDVVPLIGFQRVGNKIIKR